MVLFLFLRIADWRKIRGPFLISQALWIFRRGECEKIIKHLCNHEIVSGGSGIGRGCEFIWQYPASCGCHDTLSYHGMSMLAMATTYLMEIGKRMLHSMMMRRAHVLQWFTSRSNGFYTCEAAVRRWRFLLAKVTNSFFPSPSLLPQLTPCHTYCRTLCGSSDCSVIAA